ncbi:glycosyl transferase family 2 [Chryseobacterium sp. T16E-39]|uniref:glycosyltransferase family 2 protein n=1 Tax=Chryseobacterium sp. T16E-39 TaxID=2015076 RepID=UPI000B5B46C0|nr:glycosyltransferase family A protein [Chryseobacterium sp. T16E-39]ASK31537.1 glycosyl transferase family 2 [Chryseobacterium sp. T16E-39]
MKFSVLIAHYNNGDYFKDCFESLQKQTYTDWEAIIVDDYSNDTEKAKVKSLIADDSRFIFYENEENKGVGYTKRKCVELANGDICGFVDPDDAIFPTAIEDSVEAFKHKKNVVLTYSRFMACDENLNPLYPFKAAKQVLNNDPLFFNYPIQIAHFVAFRKEIYLKGEGIDPLLKSAVDQDLYLKILDFGDALFIPKDLYKYRLHPNGVSQATSKGKAKESFAKVIFKTFKRRNIRVINKKAVPENYHNAEEIFKLLDYQTEKAYRLKVKILTFFQAK